MKRKENFFSSQVECDRGEGVGLVDGKCTLTFIRASTFQDLPKRFSGQIQLRLKRCCGTNKRLINEIHAGPFQTQL